MSLISNVASGLMEMASHFARAHKDAERFQKQLDRIRMQTVVGGAMVGVGLFGLGLINKTLPYAKEYTRQLALMNTLGMRQADIANVVAKAWQTTKEVPTATAAENLQTFRELRSAFGMGHEREAAQMLPTVQRVAAVMQSLTGHKQEQVGFDMVKAIELRTGVMTDAALQKNAELMSQAIIGMGGTVSVQDFHSALKMGKSAVGSGEKNGWSDDFVYSYLPTLIQELKTHGSGMGSGAQSAGTYLMTLYRGDHGRVQKQAMPYWVEAGLIKPSDVVKNSTGVWAIKPGAVKDLALAESNPFLWVNQVLRPGLDRIMKAHNVSLSTAVNAMFSDRNAAFVAQNMILKAAQYERDKLTIQHAMTGYTAYQSLLKTDPNLAHQALTAQWENLLGQIGYQIMPTLVSWTLKLVGVLNGMTDWVRKHPGEVRTLTLAFAGLSAALTFGGSVLLIKAAFGGLKLVFGPLLGPLARLVGLGPGLPALATGIETLTTSLGLGAGLAAIPFAVIATGIGLVVAGMWGWHDQIKKGNAVGLMGGIKDPATGKTQGFVTPYGWTPMPGPDGKTPKLDAVGPRGAPVMRGDVHTTLNVDGRTVAKTVTPYLARSIGGVNAGTGRPDPRVAPAAPAAGYNR